MRRTILVFGAKGNSASGLVTALLGKGHHVKAFVRNPAKAETLRKEGAELVVGDLHKQDALNEAFQGVDTAYLLSPGDHHTFEITKALLAAAKASGKNPHLVRLSGFGATADSPIAIVKLHFQADELVINSGLPYTILRPHMFSDNLFMTLQSILQSGQIHWAFGNGKVSMIDARDISESAAAVLNQPEPHKNKIYTLTGPAAIDLHEVAKILSNVLNRPVTYTAVSPEAAIDSIKKLGGGDWMANVVGEFSRAYANGWGDFVSTDVATLTSHAPRSFEIFAREKLLLAAQGLINQQSQH